VTKQGAIAGQQDAILLTANTNHLRVLCSITEPDIDSQDAKSSGEPPKMDVNCEPPYSGRRRPDADLVWEVNPAKARICGNPVAGCEAVVEPCKSPVAHHGIDLDMRNPDSFDRILDRRRHVKSDRNRPPPSFRRQEVIQFAVDPDPGRGLSLSFHAFPFAMGYEDGTMGTLPRSSGRSFASAVNDKSHGNAPAFLGPKLRFGCER
jgi:hypothetical protein